MAIETERIDAYIPVIDERNEEDIYQQASDVISAESSGQINDFSDNSAAGVLLRAQVFTFAEMLYRVNKLPLILLMQFVSLAGVERVIGQRARVGLTFTLSEGRPVPFVIPAGFQVSDVSGKYTFLTTQTLVIPVGNITGIVEAEAAEIGEEYNLPAFRINAFNTPLTFLSQVTNEQPAQGGTDEESVEETINRGIVAIRQRNLVSANDFELKAQEVLGANSRAKAIGTLGSDKVSKQLGAIHIFCASAQDEPSNFAALQAVKREVDARKMLGTTIYVSPMEFTDIELRVVVKINTSVTPTVLADAMWTRFRQYLSLRNFQPGDTVFIEEVRYQLRQVRGVALLDYIILNGRAQDVPMPTAYTLPTALNMVASISDPNSATYEFGRGLLDDD